MEFIIDTADLAGIKQVMEYYPVTGVTTNPTIIAREKKDFKELVLALRELIGTDMQLHIQTTRTKAEDIVAEAEALRDLVGEPFFIKIPIDAEGLKATKILAKKGIGVTMTAIFTPQQALLSALAGAAYVAPYVNRLDGICADGVGVVSEIMDLLDNYGLETKVLAASFANVEQVHKVALCGSHAATLVPTMFEELITHPLTDVSVANFTRNWKNFYGEKTIVDLI